MKHELKHVRGFTLTELLVAMVVGLFLIGGLVALMVNSKKNYEQQEYSARLQENARFAMQFLSYDIRMSGYYGCSNVIINDSLAAVSATDSGNGNPDSITVTYGEPYEAGSEIVIDGNNGSYDPYGAPSTLYLNNVPITWAAGDTAVLVDCGGASLAEISSIDASTNQVVVDASGTDSGSLGRVFDPNNSDRGPVVVRRLVSREYCIATGESNVPTLHRSDTTAPGECDESSLELVEGVENIQLLYQGLTGGPFVDGSSAPANLAAVQLAALVRSVSNLNVTDREYGSGAAISEDDGQYTLLGQDVSGATGIIRGQRRVFNGTFAVRNRPL